MVFGGRRNNMAAPPAQAAVKQQQQQQEPSKATISATANRKKLYIREQDLDCMENHCGGHGMFSEDPDYFVWMQEPDPIVIDFKDEFRHAGTGESGLFNQQQQHEHFAFREVSKSFGGQGPVHIVDHLPQLEHLHTAWPNRRYGSESCLTIAPHHQSVTSTVRPLTTSTTVGGAIMTGCPCESVQGVHSRKTCHKMELTLEDSCCFTCGSDWSLEHTALACFECGGYGSFRPCPCGKCGETWHRDLKLTHVTGVANWMGNCTLDQQQPQPQQAKDSSSSSTTTVNSESLLAPRDHTNKVVPMRA
ncbi:hypothetical protein BV898_04854 [Hypsibius exemplaris]|uniref:Uncharacterized protein n=1 Tax=Hypsibius exemplaris TaxID=2072580 RepID=A0A1W0X0V6_HYPEX|nr:hypothetical protein BV898_04854 [Hypsibius exemplaris]